MSAFIMWYKILKSFQERPKLEILKVCDRIERKFHLHFSSRLFEIELCLLLSAKELVNAKLSLIDSILERRKLNNPPSWLKMSGNRKVMNCI